MSRTSTKGRNWAAAALIGAAALGPSTGEMAMATPLAEPLDIPAEFLSEIDGAPDWLRGAMAGLGAPEGWSMTRDAIVVSEVEALRALNRIRAFRQAVRGGTGAIWLSLPVANEIGEIRDCVTPWATQLIPDLDANDFGQSFALSMLRTDEPEACLIDVGTDDPWAGSDRTALRGYFDDAGDLMVEHISLNEDAVFVRALIEAGYLVTKGSVSGRLRVE
ncbi:hypothetical protein RTM1035_01115 [Roseovarius sp. TM1035]|uniref:hypothetical protein n=1 Tax=Roseovarius TaxID=74030 RepID=UPI0001556F0B|nr:hypothetical protein [Roseovarius sp. TM1035]AWZ20307.1 Hypothetical protein RAK1035_1596 [Roseovarius sp. AK1035]EDM29914.1 hypothetical protein RTM1035_01115 [Roseovarius sp. TM1035]